jgi:hypothetical protein
MPGTRPGMTSQAIRIAAELPREIPFCPALRRIGYFERFYSARRAHHM